MDCLQPVDSLIGYHCHTSALRLGHNIDFFADRQWMSAGGCGHWWRWFFFDELPRAGHSRHWEDGHQDVHPKQPALGHGCAMGGPLLQGVQALADCMLAQALINMHLLSALRQ